MAMPYNRICEDTVPFSDVCAKMQLATSVASSYTVPGTDDIQYRATFAYDASADVWVGYNVVAVAPTAGTLVSSPYQEYRPDYRQVKGGDVLSFISSVGTPQVGISLLQLPNRQ